MVQLLLPVSDVRLVNIDGKSVLHVAAKDGSDEVVDAVVQHFVDAGISVDMDTLVASREDNDDISGISPLQLACKKGRYHAAKRLLEAGASRHAVTSEAQNALMLACIAASPSCVSLLLGTREPYYYRPNEVNRKAAEGITALFCAVETFACIDERGIMQLCSLLIAAGADLSMGYIIYDEHVGSIRNVAKLNRPEMRKLHRLLDTGKLLRFKACAGCGAPEFVPGIKLRMCARCKAAALRYCSPECQKAHWKEHRPQCAKRT
jgi:hypothetical protein